jgi:3-isopropylmalate/(R)-2-methylmalate dehydratase small subunit
MENITKFQSRTVVLPSDDIDTDQIIPARFLTTTTREGLGEALFSDWRYDAAGKPIADFVLNTPIAKGAEILVAGDNFGCGSSREHAPWALLDYGFKAVISTQLADIFRNNALKNGLVAIVIDPETHGWLIANPGAEVEVDVEDTVIRLPDGRSVKFPLDRFSRFCLLNGTDQLGFLLQQEEAISAYEQERAWPI